MGRDYGYRRGAGRRELYDDDPYAKNTFDEEFRVVPKEKELADVSDGVTEVILKKHSWNVLRWKLK